MRRTSSFCEMTCRTAWLVTVTVCGALVFLQVCDLPDPWWIHVGFPKTVYLWIFSDSRLTSGPSVHAIVANALFAIVLVISSVHLARKRDLPHIRIRLSTSLGLLLAAASYPWITVQFVHSLWDLLVCVSTTVVIGALFATCYTACDMVGFGLRLCSRIAASVTRVHKEEGRSRNVRPSGQQRDEP